MGTFDQIVSSFLNPFPTTFEVHLLQEFPSYPFDMSKFKEIDWSSYKPQTMTILDKKYYKDVNELFVLGECSFKYNGPFDVTSAAGYYILDADANNKLLYVGKDHKLIKFLTFSLHQTSTIIFQLNLLALNLRIP